MNTKIKALVNTIIKQSTVDSKKIADPKQKFPLAIGDELKINSYKFAANDHWELKLTSPVNGVTKWFAYKPHVTISNPDLLELNFPVHVSKELVLSGVVKKGNKGDHVKRVQEWLCLRGFSTVIDRDFGQATEHCVKNFQEANHLPVTGIVEQATYDSLISPLKQALKAIPVTPDNKLSNLVLKYAQQHLAQHPLEIGGQNRGPWVRIYLEGNEGTKWAWCAGFVTFILKQACLTLNHAMPIAGSFRCNELAQQAKDNNLFVRSNEITNSTVSWQTLNPCCIFLVRKDGYWSHTGFACQPNGDTFSTIEGNTNDDGNAEGYEACIRTRSLSQKDFIRIP